MRFEHSSPYFQAYCLVSTQAMQSPELRDLDLVQELFDNYGAKQTNTPNLMECFIFIPVAIMNRNHTTSYAFGV